MAADNLERNLREGIEAARRGDKLAARRLLQSVLQQDRTNEAALMWMASVMDTVPERRAYLEQVLRINPANDRARQALERLGGTAPVAPRAASGTAAPPRPAAPISAPRRRGTNPYFLAAAAVGLVMLVVLLVFVLQPPAVVVTPTPTAVALAQEAEATDAVESAPPSVTPRPQATLPGVRVTLDPAIAALPPTFTPTPSPEPTLTQTPSPTPLPLSSYPVIFAAAKPSEFIPALFVGLADGSDVREVGDDLGYYDLALSPDAEQIAFVRDIAPAGSDSPNWQLFVAPLSDPTAARQITHQLNAGLEHPVWSNDGRFIVFAMNADGDFDLFRQPADPDGETEPAALTTNDVYDSYPAYPPDGDTLLYVSEQNSPGFPRLFQLSLDGGPRSFSNVTGANSDPAYAPDGRLIAFVNQQNSDPDVFILTSEGLRPFQLTVNDSARDRSLAWSDDGRWIAFVSDRINGADMFYFLNVDSQEVVPLGALVEAQSIAFLPR